MATTTVSLTAQQFWSIEGLQQPAELVRGQIVMMNSPGYQHGAVCYNICKLIGTFVDAGALGRVVSNDSGIITASNPDSVRGADVAYYSAERHAIQALPKAYPSVVPTLVFEVLSPTDRWKDVLTKVAEYLNAGVDAVCVLDPEDQTARVYLAERAPLVFAAGDDLTLPGVLDGWTTRVSRFFE